MVETSPRARHGPGVRALGRSVALLAAATVVALATASVVILAVAAADFLTGATESVLRLTLGSGVLAVAAAASPLVATLLVGYAYMQRGIRRRAARAALAAGAGGAVQVHDEPGARRSP